MHLICSCIDPGGKEKEDEEEEEEEEEKAPL